MQFYFIFLQHFSNDILLSQELIHLDDLDDKIMQVLICMQTYVILFPIIYCWFFGCPCSGHNTIEMKFEWKDENDEIIRKSNITKAKEILHQQKLRTKQKQIWQEKQTKSNHIDKNIPTITIPSLSVQLKDSMTISDTQTITDHSSPRNKSLKFHSLHKQNLTL
uniref:Transmembrane protein n=1 Tax=Wuchereria bancrofti TaxID=6293 RepID=A0AAF5PM85_WUCBA